MGVARWPSRLIGLALAAALLAGCGPVRSAQKARGAGHRSSTHVIRIGGLSVRVPASWRKGEQVIVAQTAVDDTYASLLLPKTTPAPAAGITANPDNRSPFVDEEIHVWDGRAQLQFVELSAGGAYYALNITAPAKELPLLRKAAASIRTPPLATATDVVKLTEEYSPFFSTATFGAKDRWLLTGGNPATAQEEYALYRSTDGGRTWALERFTTFRTKDDFMGLVGAPTIFFWTPEDGIIAETSGFSTSLLVYRTPDGGATWTSSRVTTPGQPDAMTAPTITRTAGGTLQITAKLAGGSLYTAFSADGGTTWSPAK